MRYRFDDVRARLREVVVENVQDAGGPNRFVSLREQPRLLPSTRRVAQAMRHEGGDGAWVEKGPLGERALAEADVLLDAINPAANARSRAFWSKAEQRQLEARDPDLGATVRLALARLEQGPQSAVAAVRAFFGALDPRPDPQTGRHPLHQPLPGGQLFDLRPEFSQVRDQVPARVLEAFDYYDRARAVAGVTVQRAQIEGHPVHVLYVSTDGDDGYLEVFDGGGAPLLSGRLQAGELLGIDEVFGRARFHPRMALYDEPERQEGLSEPAERAAAGQVPADWPGSLVLGAGRLNYQPASYRLTRLDVPGLARAPQAELAYAAFEFLWEESLKHRVLGTQEPFALGPLAEGTMVLGEFRRPTDGRELLVADWRDIDDGSFTLYFDRTPAGRLKLAIVQFNN